MSLTRAYNIIRSGQWRESAAPMERTVYLGSRRSAAAGVELTGVTAAPRVLFLGRTYAGHRTRFQNLEAHTKDDPRIRPTFRSVSGWRAGGWIERLPVGSPSLRGHIRAVCEAAPFAMPPRPDVLWTTVLEVAAPYLWAQTGPLRRPLIFDLDSTFDQLEEFAPYYFNRPPRRGPRRTLLRLVERAMWRSVSLFTAVSNWAADGLRQRGVPAERIRVLPPGVDLDIWRPRQSRCGDRARPLRLLFVGADFRRKGGPLLVDVCRRHFADRVELDIVTHADVAASGGVRVHRAEPNSAQLRELYANADLFVMPTLADCFGVATVEAMASGLPVIVSDVGGAPDIVEHGTTGWLITPSGADLVRALEAALAARDQLRDMGLHSRRVAELRFNGKRNDKTVVDWLLEVWTRDKAGKK